MASAYKRKNSPFWWIAYVDHSGKRVSFSTQLRTKQPESKLRLAKRLNELEAQILNRIPGSEANERWENWVTAFIKRKYQNRPGSLSKCCNSWNYLFTYFRKKQIHKPRELTREHVLDYIDWRCRLKKEKSKKTVGLNTALHDLRILSGILREADIRGYIHRNVAAQLGIERDPVKEKPEITEEQEGLIRDKLQTAPDWMRISFDIAMATGLRFNETRINLHRHVDWANEEVIIEKPKGGHKKTYRIPLHSKLKPLLKKLYSQEKVMTWELPEDTLSGIEWRKFFDELGLEDHCFHCTRVTFISRGCRLGIPENVMCKLVNHASKDINRIYQRISMADVKKWAKLLRGPAS